jgi:nucleoside 2-deoxyribosyltransferase
MPFSTFIAYGGGLPMVREAVANAISLLRATASNLVSPMSWEEMDIPGRFVATEVLTSIDSSDFIVADISRLNFNVVYEIGYAIGKGRRVLLIRHRSIASDGLAFGDLGLFDTLGWKEYSNGQELAESIKEFDHTRPLLVKEKLNHQSPVYYVQPKHKTDYDGYILAAIKKAPLRFRSFDPTESPRLSARSAIANVGQSYGVVLHFLPNDHTDAGIHNLRSAFVAGLADGTGTARTLIQSGQTPVPLDYRDLVVHCQVQRDFQHAVGALAENVFELLQDSAPEHLNGARSRLEKIDLGASAAENEMTSLAEYYVEIPAYRRALRREVRLVTGRKGSGKTAIFFRLRDTMRATRSNVVLDLKPEGYQLLKLKDSVVKLMSSGTVEHTITAFWEYILWIEICYKLLEKDQDVHVRDHRLFEPYQRLKAAYIVDDYSREGDFAERLKALLRDVVQQIEAKYPGRNDLELSAPEITGLIYKHDFYKLKSAVQEYLQFKGELWLLFDNIDKGWTSQGVNAQDLVIIRALLEATRKIERDMHKKGITAHTVVFLRNDVFENLIDTTSDRGKETRANVDWDDSELLREMLLARLKRVDIFDENADFRTVWNSICVAMIDGEDSSQYLIDRSLMRPRSLLDLIGHCRGYAVSLGHDRILRADIEKGLGAFSNDLLSELNLEIRDVFPQSDDVLYAFLGSPARLTREALDQKLVGHGVLSANLDELIEMLFWFGFLGFLWADGTPRFIYSFHYNMKVMQGTHTQLAAGGVTYVLNPAFVTALGLV